MRDLWNMWGMLMPLTLITLISQLFFSQTFTQTFNWPYLGTLKTFCFSQTFKIVGMVSMRNLWRGMLMSLTLITLISQLFFLKPLLKPLTGHISALWNHATMTTTYRFFLKLSFCICRRRHDKLILMFLYLFLIV